MYDSKKDLIRTDIPLEKNTESVEAFTIYFEETAAGANMIILWDEVKTALPIILSTEKTVLKK